MILLVSLWPFWRFVPWFPNSSRNPELVHWLLQATFCYNPELREDMSEPHTVCFECSRSLQGRKMCCISGSFYTFPIYRPAIRKASDSNGVPGRHPECWLSGMGFRKRNHIVLPFPFLADRDNFHGNVRILFHKASIIKDSRVIWSSSVCCHEA